MGRDNGAWLIVIYLFLSIYLLPMFPHGGSANGLNTLGDRRFARRKRFVRYLVDRAADRSECDTAQVDSKVFSNGKKPAQAVLAARFMPLPRAFLSGRPTPQIFASAGSRYGSFYRRCHCCCSAFGSTRESDELSLATLLFATPLFLYSLLFFFACLRRGRHLFCVSRHF